MPTASWILLALIVGSAGGAAGSSLATAIATLATVGICIRLRHHGAFAAGAAALFAIGSAARATSARWHDSYCRAEIVRAGNVELVTDFDVGPGDGAPALLRLPRTGPARGARCEATGYVSARTPLTGGRWYRTRAQAEPGERGPHLVVRHAIATGEASLRPTLRAAGVRRVDSVFLADAPVARALLLADMHQIDAELRKRWARSGLVHLLSVSGVHVAIIASALLLVGSAARLSQRHATLIALTVTAVYVVILGLPPPAVRAGIMFACALIARMRQRPASEWSVLTLGALLPVLVDPAAPLDLGWQLSVLGVVALAASGRLTRRLRWQGGGWRGGLRRELLASTVASTASAPLIAWFFGTISLIAPAANLIAAPLVTVLQPTLFLALVCSPMLPLARFIAGAAHPVLALLDRIAAEASRPAWAAHDLSPTLEQAVLSGIVVLALLVAMVLREPAQPLLLAALSGTLLVWHGLLPSRGSGYLELHMLDVGQGDAMALRTPHGRWIVIDAGGGPPGVDHGRRTVLPHIRRLGGPVEAFILSHPHLDHVGGAPAVIGAARPARYLDGAFAGATQAYHASLDSAAARAVHWQRVRPGDTTRIDGVLLRFLAPDSSWTAHLDDANLASTVVRIEYGAVRMLFVGDAERPEEEWLLQHTPVDRLRADVLKVGHHGSRTSSGGAFLDAVAPRLALISVGRGNSYGHPSAEVLDEFSRRRIPVLRTDVVGTTVVFTDGFSLSVRTAARQWSLPSPPSGPGSPPASSRP